MQACGIIPARGGSKSIPRKNLSELGGTPLIAHTILAAREAGSLTDFIVSTDDEQIAAVAREWGAEVPFMRPAELAEDHVLTVDVLRHAVGWLEDNGRAAPLTVLLQPTSPLRTAGDIDATVSKLLETDADSAITVCESDVRAEWLLRVDGDRARQLLGGFAENPQGERRQFSTPRQLLPPVYHQNGAVEVYRTQRLLAGEDMYGEDIRVVVMPREVSVDIDDRADLERAEAVLARRRQSCRAGAQGAS